MDILDRYFDDTLLTEEEQREVQRIVNSHNGLDMDVFIRHMGGMERINEMKRINEAADRLRVVDGHVYRKEESKKKEDIEEWKRGFMEGFEEAYKRLNMK